jgi:hypothetical protein
MALAKIADIERELAGLLARFAENGPEHVLQTRFQYTLDTDRLPEPAHPFQAVNYIISINQKIIDDLDDQARKIGLDSVEDALEALRSEVESLARKISMIRVTMQDG